MAKVAQDIIDHYARTPYVKFPGGDAPPGSKFDDGKPDMSLVLGGFPRALLEVGKVATYGAKKYSRDGWKEVPDGLHRYTSAGDRHRLMAATEGFDGETGFLHLAHQAWNALAALELYLKQKEDLGGKPGI